MTTTRSAAGSPDIAERGIEWYNAGADGAIDWGNPGDFEACVAIASGHLDDPEGYCANRHYDVTGEWPGPHAHGGCVTAATSDRLAPFLATLPASLHVGLAHDCGCGTATCSCETGQHQGWGMIARAEDETPRTADVNSAHDPATGQFGTGGSSSSDAHAAQLSTFAGQVNDAQKALNVVAQTKADAAAQVKATAAAKKTAAPAVKAAHDAALAAKKQAVEAARAHALIVKAQQKAFVKAAKYAASLMKQAAKHLSAAGLHGHASTARSHGARLGSKGWGKKGGGGLAAKWPATHASVGVEPNAEPRMALVATAPFGEPFPTPEYAPPDWYDEPTWIEDWRAEHGLGPARDPESGILRLTITDEGRVGAYFYEKGACLLDPAYSGSGGRDCWMPSPSPTNYAAFHQQDVVTAGGNVLTVGVIGNVGGHADAYASNTAASEHYANPDRQMIVARAGDNARGGWIAGSVVPGLTYRDVALLRRSALSGDWRPFGDEWFRGHGADKAVAAAADHYDCIGPTLVTRPGLPLVRQFRGSAGAVYLGGAGGVQLGEKHPTPAEVAHVHDQVRVARGTAMEPRIRDRLAQASRSLTIAQRFITRGDDPAEHLGFAATALAAAGHHQSARTLRAHAEHLASPGEDHVMDDLFEIEAQAEPLAGDEAYANGAHFAAGQPMVAPPDDKPAEKLTPAELRHLAAHGKALPDAKRGGSFPIRHKADLAKAKTSLGQAGSTGSSGFNRAKNFVNKRAKELGAAPVGAQAASAEDDAAVLRLPDGTEIVVSANSQIIHRDGVVAITAAGIASPGATATGADSIAAPAQSQTDPDNDDDSDTSDLEDRLTALEQVVQQIVQFLAAQQQGAQTAAVRRLEELDAADAGDLPALVG